MTDHDDQATADPHGGRDDVDVPVIAQFHEESWWFTMAKQNVIRNGARCDHYRLAEMFGQWREKRALLILGLRRIVCELCQPAAAEQVGVQRICDRCSATGPTQWLFRETGRLTTMFALCSPCADVEYPGSSAFSGIVCS